MGAAVNSAKTVSQGDVFSMRFPVRDKATNGPAQYTSPFAYFALGDKAGITAGETPDLTKDSDQVGGVRILQETISGVQWWIVYVDFAEADTLTNLSVQPGAHYFEVKVVDGPSRRETVATGQLVIKPTIIR